MRICRVNPPPLLDVKHDTNLFVNSPPVIYLFSFLHIGTAFMVIVQFSGHLVQQFSWAGNYMCLISLYLQGIPILSPVLFMPSLYSTS